MAKPVQRDRRVNPVLAGAGIAVAGVGAVTQAWIDRGARQDRWMLMSGL